MVNEIGMVTMTDILLIEDNIELSNLIQVFLNKEGFSLMCVSTGEEAIQWLSTHEVSIVLLDIMLPQMDGFTVCKHIRQEKNIPIIIMSACSAKSDKLTGFELGADDYMEKPIDPDILCAKIRAIRNRSVTIAKRHNIIRSGDIQIDTEARSVYIKENKVEFNVKEYDLLMLLIENPGKTLHKDYLFREVWGFDSFSEPQTLTVHIKMLRLKIEDDPKKPKRIVTVWGVGYRYEEL